MDFFPYKFSELYSMIPETYVELIKVIKIMNFNILNLGFLKPPQKWINYIAIFFSFTDFSSENLMELGRFM